ncbi:MAG: hypothetical protein RSB55_08305, partial [Oscillospiraceae bacterium]
MISQITLGQAARAMKLEERELRQMLARCGIPITNDMLFSEQIDALLHALEEQGNQSRQRAQEAMERAVQKHSVLIDTCSLLCRPCDNRYRYT